ncbi:MAG TPA: DUF3078 domain-containing protein [Bacteroidales bacterium]|nr:DUF3078 domain-containing protein [Bacteroidales bacterium]
MKRDFIKQLTIIAALVAVTFSARSQENVSRSYVHSILDSLGRKGIITYTSQEKPVIRFTPESAVKYLQEKYRTGDWNNPDDPLRLALGELIFVATHQKYDSLENYFKRYPYDSIGMPWMKFFKWDSLKMKIPVIVPQGFSMPQDTIHRRDTIHSAVLRDSPGNLIRDRLPDSLKAYRTTRPASTVVLKDTVFLVASRMIPEVTRFSSRQPFRLYRFPYQSDSIALAVRTITASIEKADSSVIRIMGMSRSTLPVWINSRSEKMERYWLRNESADSVTLWIGTAGRDTLGVYLEDGIIFKRPVKQTNISNAQLNLKKVNSGSLQSLSKVYVRPRYWKYRTEDNLLLNQTYLTNWASGGQSSLSFALDAFGYADYVNDSLKLTSNNFLRIKYGLLKPGLENVRKSVDQIELNTKLNHKAFGKFDFSATLIFKTQLTRGYDYPNDSVPVSTFMNPGYLTIGLGLDYKPNKKTSINFAPLTYRATFMTDTVMYSRTKYGLPRGRKSLQEPGISLQVINEYSPFKMLTLTNRLQLFTSYTSFPSPNYVIDWEMIATSKLNWFTDVRLNTHLIYDDKVLIPLVDSKGKPVMGPDGKQRTGKRVQFKELLGFSFVFKF